MNYVIAGLSLGLFSLSLGYAGYAQEANQLSGPSPNSLLNTQPATVNQAPRPLSSPYSADALNQVAESIQAKPTRPAKNPLIPDNLLPAELVDKLSQQQKPPALNPLDYFQVPPMNSSVKVTVDQN